MEIEDQVVSLELAKKMKELGFEQESLWHWRYSHTGCHPSNPLMSVHQNEFMKNPKDEGGWYCFSAYTVAELGEMLPVLLKIENDVCILEYIAAAGKFGLGLQYYNSTEKCLATRIKADTEANARAKMLIYLKENSLI